MTTPILQLIIKQWDKSERTEQHDAERASLPSCLELSPETSVYAFNQQCIIDQRGDDIMGDRLRLSQSDDNTVDIDRFTLSLTDNTLIYNDADDEETPAKNLGCIKDNFIQCRYQWRYRVFEGGFYYWLYEDVILNAISVDEIDPAVFLTNEPDIAM